MVVIEDHGSSSRHDGACALLATAGSKGVVRLWNVSSSWRIEPAMAQASGASVEARGGYVALQQYREVVSDLCYDKEESPAVRLIVANAEHQLCVLESRRLRTMQTLVGHLDDILDLRILHSHNWESADVGTSRIAIATNSAEIRLMNVVTANADTSIGVASSTTTTLTGHTAAVLCLDISPCDLFLISCGKDRTVRIWELDSQQCVAVATGHTEAVGAAAFSRKAAHYRQTSSDHLAFCVSVSVDRTLKRWNLPRAVLAATGNGQCTLMAAATVRAHEKDINMVTVAPNDSLVATASQDKTVKLWNATDLSIRATLKGHRRGVWDVQFSPVDRVVATASGDKTLKLWSLADYACVR
jgi:U3 small nucleolar RNA-associated protein 13